MFEVVHKKGAVLTSCGEGEASRIPDGRGYCLLDILRFICALSIVAWHYEHYFAINPNGSSEVLCRPLEGVFSLAYNFGGFAVPIFWALSGFLFFWRYSAPLFSGEVTPLVFMVRRISRLYPLHFLTLLFMAAITPFIPDTFENIYMVSPENNNAYNFLAHLFFVSGIIGGTTGGSFNAVVWSVSLEVVAYCVFVGTCINMSVNTIRVSLYLFLVSVVGLVCARLVGAWAVPLAQCTMYFFLGEACYYVARTEGWMGWSIAFTSIGAAAFIVALASDGVVPITAAVGSISASLIISGARFDSWVRPPLLRRLMSGLGIITFSSYMLHLPISVLLICLFDVLSIPVQVFFKEEIFIGFLIGVFLISWLSFVYYESPCQRWLRSGVLQSSRGFSHRERVG